MKFRDVKTSVVSLLGAAAAGRYRVLGYQEQDLDDDEITGNNRLVQVFASAGNFNPSRSGRGPFALDVTLMIEMIVAESAQVDLTVLDDPAATPAQIATALAAAKPAAARADEQLDELFDLIFNEIMKGDNLDLGMSVGDISDRWLSGFKKGDPQNAGDRVVLSSVAMLTFRTSESVVSTDKYDIETIDSGVSIQGDGDPKAGVKKDY